MAGRAVLFLIGEFTCQVHISTHPDFNDHAHWQARHRIIPVSENKHNPFGPPTSLQPSSFLCSPSNQSLPRGVDNHCFISSPPIPLSAHCCWAVSLSLHWNHSSRSPCLVLTSQQHSPVVSPSLVCSSLDIQQTPLLPVFLPAPLHLTWLPILYLTHKFWSNFRTQSQLHHVNLGNTTQHCGFKSALWCHDLRARTLVSDCLGSNPKTVSPTG